MMKKEIIQEILLPFLYAFLVTNYCKHSGWLIAIIIFAA
jgi:hypothetical protein